MNFKKNLAISAAAIAITLFSVVGVTFALNTATTGGANGNVDATTLQNLYEAAFHRPADSEGLQFHTGRPLQDVLRDFNNSPEMRYYGALFKAVKSYEEDQRAPGTLTSEEKQSHLDLINSALSTLLAWVDTLPDHETCTTVIGADEAQAAIKAAYDGMSPAAKLAAQQGVFNALQHIGPPADILLHPKCVRPTPSVTPVSTCIPPPPCLNSTPRCLPPMPAEGWCHEPSPTPTGTCIPPPPCLHSTPRCLPPEPAGGWCPSTTPTPTPTITVGTCDYASPPAGCHYEGLEGYPVCGAHSHLVCPTPTPSLSASPSPTQ